MGKCLSKQKKKKGKRKSAFSPKHLSEIQQALNELIDTESDFGGDLKVMISCYLDPLRTQATFFDNTELILFNSVTLDLVQVQEKFQQKLESHICMEPMNPGVDVSDVIFSVGDDFITSEKEFEIFSKYIVAMSHVQNLISGKSKVDNSKKIVEFLDHQSSKLEADFDSAKIMTMESLLLKPLQRVMLYPLILERLEKQSEEGTCDKEQILDAITSIKKVATQMNETLKRDEQNGAEFKALLKQYGIAEYKKT